MTPKTRMPGWWIVVRALNVILIAFVMVRTLREVPLSFAFGERVGTDTNSSFLERHAHAIRINRPKLFRTPRLGLPGAVGVYLASALLEFRMQRFNPLYCESHHGLVADLSCESLIIHARYV